MNRSVKLVKKKQIFISHSSIDKKLLKEIKETISKERVIPFVASEKLSGENPAEKIIRNMMISDAMFIILTKNVLQKRSTRDWVFFEVGVAKGMWTKYNMRLKERDTFEQYRIYGWKDTGVDLPDDSSIKMITDYKPVNLCNNDSKQEMLKDMKEIAKKLHR